MKKFKNDLTENDVTSESAFMQRRKLIKNFSAGIIGASLPISTQAGIFDGLFDKDNNKDSEADEISRQRAKLTYAKNTQWDTNEQKTSEYTVTHYNNFYEFGLDKKDPAKNSQDFITSPWEIEVSGLTNKPGTYDIEKLLQGIEQEERIYRLRCVEAWSMVIPWVGVPLAALLKKLDPLSSAKFVKFYTLHDPKQMPGQKPGRFGLSSLKYPYVEGLRMDEAMNPLSLMATGLYGKKLPPQNGAPIRLVVPWKYGFKGIKSIVKIEFLEQQPINTWNDSAPKEYGFYANVNPHVDHPRWTQARERRLVDESAFSVKRIKTEMFNGYAEHVADLYKGMDLAKNF